MRGLRLGVSLAGGRVAAPVVIANNANTTVIDTGGKVYTIQKTGGVDGTYDASAVSSLALTGDFTLRMKLLVAGTTNCGGGMNSDPLTDNNFTSIDRMWLYNVNGFRDIYESGGAITASLADATYCWIWRRGTSLKYGRGATIAIAQASPDRAVTDSSTLYFDSSFAGTNGKIEAYLTA